MTAWTFRPWLAVVNATGVLLHTLAGHEDHVRAVRFDPTGQVLASCSNDGTVRLWDVRTGQLLQTLSGHQESVYALAFVRDGLLVSGGNMANFVGFLVGRRAKTDWDVRKAGMFSGTPLRVYASQETHTWIQKAADLFGFGTDAIAWVPTDDRQRMDTGRLRSMIQEDRQNGVRPLMVVGTAGTVGTGAIDPLNELADICAEQDLWFHVDGAYGAFAAALPDASADLRALSRADSVAMDPHKWLYAPLEAGCVLVRRRELLRESFSYHPPYYHFDPELTNYFDFGPQNSRGFRALKVWLALRQAGREAYERMIAQDIRLAGELYRILPNYPELERLTHGLSIVTFRYIPPDLRPHCGTPEVDQYLDDLNRKILDQVEAGGEAFLSNAVINGRFALRLCIVNFRTSLEDIESLPPLIVRLGREVDGDRAYRNPPDL
ncbi:MAG TPA: aminotransferase class V-fold PLP-dependent enzyme, partial [Acidobacteriota bacterium]|nr:aminotransferase class V-fold PLP-dependent enzyme [Acidobacteriota bacterium]